MGVSCWQCKYGEAIPICGKLECKLAKKRKTVKANNTCHDAVYFAEKQTATTIKTGLPLFDFIQGV